jgi:hypothetical protein
MRHLAELLCAAGTSDARFMFLFSLMNKFPMKGALSAEGEVRELCTGGAINSLVKGVSSLLVGAERRALPPLKFGFDLNFLKPYHPLGLAFLILSAIRKKIVELGVFELGDLKIFKL